MLLPRLPNESRLRLPAAISARSRVALTSLAYASREDYGGEAFENGAWKVFSSSAPHLVLEPGQVGSRRRLILLTRFSCCSGAVLQMLASVCVWR